MSTHFDSGVTPTVATPFSGSGTFLAFAEDGRLVKMADRILQFCKLATRKNELEARREQYNNPLSLAILAHKKSTNFTTSLVQRVHTLENALAELLPCYEELRQLLERECPGITAPIVERPAEAWQTVIRLKATLRARSPEIAARNNLIRRSARLPDLQICSVLDENLSNLGGITIAFPATWTRRFGVKTFREAYMDGRCRPLIHTLIYKVKNL